MEEEEILSSDQEEDKKEDEDEGDKKKKPGKISFDIVKFFTDIGAPECVNKLQKQDLLDPELFFKVEFSTLESVALNEVKPEGKKIKVNKKVKEIREKYEKEGSIEYLDMGLLEMPDDVPVLKFQKSTTMGIRGGSSSAAGKTRSPTR